MNPKPSNATPSLPRHELLDGAGLNRQHVFNLSELPPDLRDTLQPQPHESQLLLFGHGGRRLWDCVQGQASTEAHPIDSHSIRTVRGWLATALPTARARWVFPGETLVGLQRLGQLAGWHHPSPFMVGIDSVWGSWFAYRAVIITDTSLAATPKANLGHPCPTCTQRPCVRACAAGALDGGRFDFDACVRGRLAPQSPCALGCTARMACPVGAEHRYDISQIRHSSTGSLSYLKRHLGTT